jgi:hypothetical protein
VAHLYLERFQIYFGRAFVTFPVENIAGDTPISTIIRKEW